MLTNNLPIIRGFKYSKLPYHVGSVTENILGIQVLRVISKFILWSLRKPIIKNKKIKNYVEILETDGVLIIENFLSENELRIVTNEFENATKDIKLTPYKGVENSKLFRTQITTTNDSSKFENILKNFQKSEILNEIASGIIRRKIKEPEISLDIYQKVNEKGFDNDIENILHADLHTTTIKMFFYLNDVNEMNGAFIYAKGTHKLTIERLKHEYELSIRQAKLKSNRKLDESLIAKRGNELRNIIKPQYFTKLKETQFCVKKNSLVIANNMGFHRRGEFLGSIPRKAILINYRNSERTIL